MNDRDLDDEFARIVAGWEAEAPDPQRRDAPGPGSDVVAAGEEADLAPRAEDRPGPVTEPSGDPDASAEAASGEAASGEAASGLGLPIAPTTSHVWRGATPMREDADALLERAGSEDTDPEDPDDHFVPPSQIDLPSAETDPMFWAIVGGLVGGPLLLLYLLFFDRDGSGWWVVTAITMVVVGFVLLVLRGGTDRDPFDDGTRV